MKYEETQQYLKARERQRREREPLLNAEEYKRFLDEPTKQGDVECVIAGSQYRFITYNRE